MPQIRKHGGGLASTSGAGPATPNLIQHISSTSNPVGLSPAGNNFQFVLPNAIGAGNCLVLAINYQNGLTPSITDNNGNSWPGSPSVSADAGAGNYVSSIFVLPNANAGITKITVGLGSTSNQFQCTISEFNNIATASPVNGTSSSAAVAGASLTTGSFTPTTNNNANGGNLIWSYFAIGKGTTSNPSSWVPGGSFILLDGDIAWVNNGGVPHASQYFVQTSQGAINPGITATGDTDSFNGVSVALKVASAGTAAPAGIHINKDICFTCTGTLTTFKMQVPTTGNLRVFLTAFPPSFLVASGVTDSDGNNDWVHVNLASDQPQCWYSPNHGASNNLTVTFTFSTAANGVTFHYYDVANAAASPANGSAGVSSTSEANVTSFSNQPVLTPTTNTNGVAMATTPTFGSGPINGNTGPSGAVYDAVNYTGLTNSDLLNNGDGYAIVYYATNATENWNWTCVSASDNSVSSLAVAFK